MREQMRREAEEKLLELPVVQYAWMEISDLEFSEKVRHICRTECPRYGASWSCPPAVGTVEECRSRCRAFSGAFVFTTVAEVHDAENMEETLATRGAHEAVTKEIREILGMCAGKAPDGRGETLALSAESCAICGSCAYPDGPCRHPERMLPCIESYGIVVPRLAEKAGIEFMNGAGTVTWFGIVFFTE